MVHHNYLPVLNSTLQVEQKGYEIQTLVGAEALQAARGKNDRERKEGSVERGSLNNLTRCIEGQLCCIVGRIRFESSSRSSSKRLENRNQRRISPESCQQFRKSPTKGTKLKCMELKRL